MMHFLLVRTEDMVKGDICYRCPLESAIEDHQRIVRDWVCLWTGQPSGVGYNSGRCQAPELRP